MATAKEKIVLGSGKLYIQVWDGAAIPADNVLEVDQNLLGLIQGGATLEYKPEYYDTSDDLGLAKKIIMTKEDVTLKSGVMTWNGRTLAKLCATARVIETGTKRTVKFGGIVNQNNDSYVLRFVHEDTADGDIRITIVGSNTTGFSFAFAKDKETVLDVEFKAVPQDDEGTLVLYEEEIALDPLVVTSVAGATSGKTAITVAPTLTSGCTYVYKTDASVTLPAFGDELTTGWTAWNGTDDITATTGNEIAICEIDEDDLAQAGGKTTVVSKA